MIEQLAFELEPPRQTHPDHHGHELRCVTYNCNQATSRLRFETTTLDHCITNHAVRCITCHVWADEPTYKRRSA